MKIKKYVIIYIVMLIITEIYSMFTGDYDNSIVLFDKIVYLTLPIIFICIIIIPIVFFILNKNKVLKKSVEKKYFIAIIVILCIIFIAKIIFIARTNNDLKQRCEPLEKLSQYSTMADVINDMGIVKKGSTIEKTIEYYEKEIEYNSNKYDGVRINTIKKINIQKKGYTYGILSVLTSNFKGDFNSKSAYTNFLRTYNIEPSYKKLFETNGYYSVKESVFIFSSIFELISAITIFIILRKNDNLV